MTMMAAHGRHWPGSGFRMSLAAALLVVVGLTGCRSENADSPTTEVLARVNGTPITAADVDPVIAQSVAELEDEIYRLRRERLETVIGERLLAAEAGRRQMNVSQMVDQEIRLSGTAVVSETEVDELAAANRSRWNGTEVELRSRVREELARQKNLAAREAFVARLRSSATVVVSLPPPEVHRFTIPLDNAAAVRGDADAPITIVEFTDFHCPYCRSVQPTIEEVRRRYGRQIRHVQHDVPIDQIHPRARPAHEAARCAGEQHKFWEYREHVFAQCPAPPERLSALAADVGLDLKVFEACRTGSRATDAVARSSDMAASMGIQATPTFFINGRILRGAQPLEAFTAIIDDELRSR
jgi:protein-disulfide isomerase